MTASHGAGPWGATRWAADEPAERRPRVVEWYRLDASRRIMRVLIPGAGVLTVGSFLVSCWMVIGTPSATDWVLGSLGLALVIAGPLAAIIGLTRVLEAEDYLIVRTDGLLHQIEGEQWMITWDDVAHIRYDDDRDAVELRTRDDDCVRLARRFSGIDTRALAQRLEEVRRKAIWNLLPQQQ